MLVRVAPWIALIALVAVQVGIWITSDPESTGEPPLETDALSARLERLEERLEVLDGRLGSGDRLAAHRSTLAESDEGTPTQSSRPSDSETDPIAELEARIAALEGLSQDAAPDPRQLAAIGALNDALAQGRWEDARRLLETGLDPDARDEDRRTPLAAASVSGNLEMIDLLIDHGAGLERKAGRRSMTPLLAALDADQEDAALHLLERGALPTAVDKNGESALIWASFNGMPRVVRELLDRGVDVDYQCHSGGTALADAVRKGHVEVVRVLLENGADPNLVPESAEGLSSSAVRGGNAEIIELLRRYGAR